MVCSSCGKENKNTGTYCEFCGTELKSTYAQAQQNYYIDDKRKGYPDKNEWTAYIGMICGILSVSGMFCTLVMPIWAIFTPFFCFVTGIGGIVLGAVGLKTNYKGMATAGLCCGVAGILLEIAAIVVVWKTVMILLGLA